MTLRREAIYPQQGAQYMVRGDHLIVSRGSYSHHAIDLGDGSVIHYAGDGTDKSRPVVRRDSLDHFARGATVSVRAYGSRLGADEAVARAESMLGRADYDLSRNNCEHFVSWCITGVRSSQQVEAATAAIGLGAFGVVGPRIGAGLATGAGGGAARSGSNVVSGLAAIGGGRAIHGVKVLAVAGGALGILGTCVALRDRPTSIASEREARRAGRGGSVAGGALGVWATVQVLDVLGTPGLDAAGITSGLARFGQPLGGRMVAGVGMAMLLPMLIAIAVGLIVKWLAGRVDRPGFTSA
jgi:hypothetical protein